MRDVAEMSGVSLKTVSRVINAEAGVATATAARVGDAIAALGFQRNDLARSLRHGLSSSTLGLVIEDFANPFYALIAQAVETAARERGCLLITASAREDSERERELVGALVGRRVDALLIVPAGPDQRYVESLRGRTAFVYIDRPPGGLEADTVLLDDGGGARRAVEHLLARGHRRIACVADHSAIYTARERVAGYAAALSTAGIALPELIRTGSPDAAHGERAVCELLDLPPERRPTAIFSANNRNTIGALHALVGREQEIALVGFDDFELADLLGITVVRADAGLLGARAAALAFARLDGDERPPQLVTIATELVERGSGERIA